MSKEHKCTLSQLYPSTEIKIIIREKLIEVFKFKFESLLTEASAFRPFLVCPARYFEEDIKYYFIEEGQQIDCVEHLEFALYRLNFLKFREFRKAKESFEKSIEVDKNIIGEKRVSFDI
jgi:hypothetical protein